MPPEEFIASVISRIPEQAEFDDLVKNETGRVIEATAKGPDNDEHSFVARELLADLTTGYGY